jgi:hypothetical protein
MNSIILITFAAILNCLFVVNALPIVAPKSQIGKNNATTQIKKATKQEAPPTALDSMRGKRQNSYYSLGNDDYKPGQFNDGVSSIISNQLQHLNDLAPQAPPASEGPNHQAPGWVRD